VKESVVHNLITLISNAEELQGYAVRRLYAALVEALASPAKGEPALLYAAAWCIGEYGEMLPAGEAKRLGWVVGCGGGGGEGGVRRGLRGCALLYGALESMGRCCQQVT
jgi:hypothetical protein